MFILPILDYGDVLYAGTHDVELERLDKIHEDVVDIVLFLQVELGYNLMHEVALNVAS